MVALLGTGDQCVIPHRLYEDLLVVAVADLMSGFQSFLKSYLRRNVTRDGFRSATK